jgi:tetratricopeptide (TPR) repeat protein
MTSKDTLPVARHYYEIGKYQRAYDHLVSMDLNIGREHQIEHHLLLADILNELDRFKEAQELTDELLGRFPDNHDCIVQWIQLASEDFNRVDEAYGLAQSMQKTEPDDYWFPMMMAQMAFQYRLKPKATIIGLVEQTLGMESNEQTLLTACLILGYYNKPAVIKSYLDELVGLAPDAESTYLILLDFLAQSKRYTELGQISYEAIRQFPNNIELIEHLETATNHLYGGYFGRLFNFCVGIGRKIRIKRSSNKSWFRIVQRASDYLGSGISVLALIVGVILCALPALFFYHYVIFTDDERNIRKQRKRRLQKHEFVFDDQVTDMNDATSVLVSSTHLKYRFMYLSPKEIVLARDVWCPVENLHFDLDTEHLHEFTSIDHQQIKRIEVSSKYLAIKTIHRKIYLFYFESIETLYIILGQLEKYDYRLTRTKHGSRFLLALCCLLGAKAGLSLSFFVFLVSWKIGVLLLLMVLTNIFSLFIYRFIFPLRTDIYQYQLSHS